MKGEPLESAECTPAEVRAGPEPIQLVMAPVSGRASQSMMCTTDGSSIAERYQLELSDSSLTIANASRSLGANLMQGRKMKESLFPTAGYTSAPPNTSQKHVALLADGRGLGLTRERNGVLIEAWLTPGQAGASLLNCRL